MRDERGREPYRQRRQRYGCDPLKPPVFDAVLCRAEAKCPAEGVRMGSLFMAPSCQDFASDPGDHCERRAHPTTIHPDAYIAPSSKPYPASQTRWRMPPQRCRKNEKVQTNSNIWPTHDSMTTWTAP